MPLTRPMKSCQLLKSPFLRSLTISRVVTGPMPLTLSSSASVALLTSTAAKAVISDMVAKKARNFLNMNKLPGWKKLAYAAHRASAAVSMCLTAWAEAG